MREGEAILLVWFVWPGLAWQRQRQVGEVCGGGGENREAENVSLNSSYM
jgi:hypothetical protein